MPHQRFRYRRPQTGLTLVEVLVALVIGSLTVLAIQQVMAVFEGQKRTSTSGADAQINGAIALFSIEREVKQAGYGLFGGEGSLCPLGVNIHFNGTTVVDGGVLRPLTIIDGGAGPDAIEFMRSDTDFAAVPTAIVRNMTDLTDPVVVESSAGLSRNQLFLAVGKDGGKICTLMQLSHTPAMNSGVWTLKHESSSPYNPLSPGTAFSTKHHYGVGDTIINMGSLAHRRYQILCDRLTEVNPTTVGAPWDCDNTDPVADQVIDLQAQYGVAAAGSVQISQWCDASSASSCGDWSSPDTAATARIRAIRLAVVARSTQYEKEAVSPATLTLWETGSAGDDPPQRALTGAEQHYRYKVFTTIVPIRNVIWGG